MRDTEVTTHSAASGTGGPGHAVDRTRGRFREPLGSRLSRLLRPDSTALANRVALLAVVAFAVLGIGAPLLGTAVFSNTDLLVSSSPYRGAGLDTPEISNRIANDVVASVVPNTELFADELRDGRLAAWNPYIGGGSPLGSVPNFAVASPLSIPYYLLPMSVAPAYAKLLEIACAVGGCFLFLRRLRLGRAAALLGGLAFASSAFMVMWSNWPQTRVAAFIPAVFWAAERLATERRVRDAALVAAAVAAMLLGGFPAVTGYTVLTAGAYLLVRLLAERPARWRPVLGTLTGAGAALVVAVATTAVQLLPFADAMSRAMLRGRAQNATDHLEGTSLITAVAPWSLGSVNSFLLERNAIEAMSYVGAVALVLAFVAVALPWRARILLPRGVWTFLTAATAGWLVVIYFGGWPLAALQQLPALFSDSFVGRARSVLGLLIAALVAVGFELLLRRIRASDGAVVGTEDRTWSDAPAGGGPAGGGPGSARAGRPVGRRLWIAAVLLTGGVGLALLAWNGRRSAAGTSPGALHRYELHLLVAAGLLGAAVLCVLLLVRAGSGGRLDALGRAGRRWRRGAAAAVAALPALVALQAVSLVLPYWPAADPATFYPETEVHRYLATHLGHDRFAAADGGMYPGADSAARLRSLTGETFFETRFGETIQALPDELFSTTLLRLTTTRETAQSPVLDRLAVRYLVSPPWAPIFGRTTTVLGDGGVTTLTPGSELSVPIPRRGPLRAIGVTFPERVTGKGWLEVSVRDATGQEVARGDRRLIRINPGEPFFVPVTGERIPPGESLTATLTLRAGRPVEVATVDGTPALSTVAGEADGLALVHAGDSVVWQRLSALPRIRWASGAEVAADPADRLAAVIAPAKPDSVILDTPPVLVPEGRPAQLGLVQDGTDAIEVLVDAEGAGHLVIADAIQGSWRATIDGEPADLVPADHGLAAVAVPAGRHTVRLHYAMPRNNLGAYLSAAGLTALLAVGAGAVLRDRARARRRGRASGGAHSGGASDAPDRVRPLA